MDRMIRLYLLMIACHAGLVLEEVFGQSWLLQAMGFRIFLVVNWAILCIPIGLFYFVLKLRRWAINLSMIYTGIMIAFSLGLIVLFYGTRSYFGGAAGIFAGAGVIVIGALLLISLRRLREISVKDSPWSNGFWSKQNGKTKSSAIRGREV